MDKMLQNFEAVKDQRVAGILDFVERAASPEVLEASNPANW